MSVASSKTIKCFHCDEYKKINHFASRDVVKRRGVLQLKNGKKNAICNECGNDTPKSHQAQLEKEKIWTSFMDDTFDEHCEMLAFGEYTPWLYSYPENKGRSFSDRKCVSWKEIIERIEYFKEQPFDVK